MRSANENPKRRGLLAALTRPRGRHSWLPTSHRGKMTPKNRMVFAATITAVALVAGVASSAVQASTAPSKALAAQTGAGYSGITPYGGYLGSYIAPDGSKAICIDSSADWPSGATGGATIVSSLTTESGDPLSPSTLQKLNYATDHWLQSDDPTQTAAVNVYGYAYTSTKAHYNGQQFSSGAFYASGNPAITNTARAMWDQTEANAAAVQGAVPLSGSMYFDVDHSNNYNGSIVVTGMPAGARVNLTLTNGVFKDSGSRTRNAVGNGSYPVHGTPPDGDATYKISAVGDASMKNGFTYDANVTIYYTPGQQRIIKAGTKSDHIDTWRMTATDPFERSTLFSPIVTSKVESRFVADGDSFTDTLQASVAPGSQPWRQFTNGTGLSVVAKGTLYYLGAEQPAPGSEIPADATVVGTASVTLKGPGTYKAPSVLPADHKPGFYNWVWGITASDSSVVSQLYMPTNYSWADQSGLEAETHVVAAKLSGVSQVRDDVIGFSHLHQDTLTVTLDEGPWPTIGGQPIPAHFQNKTYWVAGDTEPVAGDTVPADAELFHTTDVTVTEPGDYTSDEFPAPPTTAGYLVNVWSIVQDGPGAGYFTDWTDGWATPGEVTRVSPPDIATEATASTALGDESSDTGIIGAPVPAPYCGTATPAEGATTCPNTVTYAAYLQEDLGEQPVCEASNEVFNTGYVPDTAELENDPARGPPTDASTATPTPAPTKTPLVRDATYFYNKPIPVTEAGKYPSADVIFKKVGVYFWVITFRTGDGTIIHTGECGDPKEKTVVAEDDVVTKATPTVGVTQKGRDTALVTGVIPKNATLEFAVYKQSGSTPVCEASNEVEVGKPQPLPATGEYVSDDYTFNEVGTYFWVEIVRNARGEITHQGKCGAEGETTIVTALATTGSDEAAYLPIGIALASLFVGAGAVLFIVTRRTKRTTTK